MANKKDFLSYERPSVTADVVLFDMQDSFINTRRQDDKLFRVLLMKRDTDPHNGKWSLPGGFVGIDKSIEEVAKEKVLEKVGYKNFYMEQLYTFDDIDRDERWRVISTSYIGILKPNAEKEKETPYETQWFVITDDVLIGCDGSTLLNYEELAFDHGKIIKMAVERIKNKLFYSDIGFEFMENEFTVGSLRKTFEVILDKKIDNFKRTMSDKIEETENKIEGRAYRPAKLFRKKENYNY